MHWMKINDPSDLERAINRMLNKILTCDDPMSHAGKFASLANAWVNVRKLSLDTLEIQQIKEELKEIRKQISEKADGPIVRLEKH